MPTHPPPPLPNSAGAGLRGDAGLDATDARILAALCEDGRLSMRALAERAGISRAAAYSRVERLRADGTIARFTTRLDPSRLGLGVTAVVLLTLDQHDWQDALADLREVPGVTWCAATTGEFDAVVLVRARDIDMLRDAVLQRLGELPRVRRTRTTLVLEESLPDDGDLLRALTAR